MYTPEAHVAAEGVLDEVAASGEPGKPRLLNPLIGFER
jgi:hypothetical protein